MEVDVKDNERELVVLDSPIYMHAYVHTHMHAHVHIYIHTRARAHTHTHKHKHTGSGGSGYTAAVSRRIYGDVSAAQARVATPGKKTKILKSQLLSTFHCAEPLESRLFRQEKKRAAARASDRS